MLPGTALYFPCNSFYTLRSLWGNTAVCMQWPHRNHLLCGHWLPPGRGTSVHSPATPHSECQWHNMEVSKRLLRYHGNLYILATGANWLHYSVPDACNKDVLWFLKVPPWYAQSPVEDHAYIKSTALAAWETEALFHAFSTGNLFILCVSGLEVTTVFFLSVCPETVWFLQSSNKVLHRKHPLVARQSQRGENVAWNCKHSL